MARRARPEPALPRDDAARRAARPDRPGRRRGGRCWRSTSTRSPIARTCAAPAEAGLVNITRIDPATRPRAARVVERLRRRVDAGEEPDLAVLGTISAEMGMAGEPAGPMAELAERALDGFDLTRLGGRLVGLQRRALARRGGALRRRRGGSLDRALEVARERGAVLDVGAALVFRAELYLQTGDIASRGGRRAELSEIAGVCGWPMGDGFAAAWLGEVLIERGELEEAAAVLPGARGGCAAVPLPADLGAARARPAAAGAGPLRGGGRGPARVGAAARSASGTGPPPSRRGARCWPRRCSGSASATRRGAWSPRSSSWRAPSAPPRAIGVALRAMARVEGDDELAPAARGGRGARRLAGAARARPRARRARRRAAPRGRGRRGARAAAARRRPGAPLRRRALEDRRSASCGRPARGRAGGRRRAPARSRRASAGSPSWRPSGARTARSRRRCSSPPRRWSSTCATRIASSGSAGAPA